MSILIGSTLLTGGEIAYTDWNATRPFDGGSIADGGAVTEFDIDLHTVLGPGWDAGGIVGVDAVQMGSTLVDRIGTIYQLQRAANARYLALAVWMSADGLQFVDGPEVCVGCWTEQQQLTVATGAYGSGGQIGNTTETLMEARNPPGIFWARTSSSSTVKLRFTVRSVVTGEKPVWNYYGDVPLQNWTMITGFWFNCSFHRP